jgi:hypothetical protein
MVRHRVFVMGMAPEEALTAPRMSHNQKTVERLTLDGEVVERYQSLAEAARQGQFSKTSVHHCLMGRAKTSGGFRWRYAPCEEPSTGRESL